MPEVPIPFTGEEVDTDDDATSILVTVAMVAVGFGLFAWLQGIGGFLADTANSTISGMLGFDPTSGEDAGGVPGV